MIRDLLIYHHSHLDVGYTHHPSVVWRRQADYLRWAMTLAERYQDGDPGEQFKWTAESAAVVERFLESASPDEVRRLVALHESGLMETSALYCNTTPLFTPSELWAMAETVRRLRRRWGLPIVSAVNHDVNGEAWTLPDLLATLGVSFLVMGINRDSARIPAPRPRAFWWEGYGGARILVWNGEHYGFAQRIGIPRPDAWHAGSIDLDASATRIRQYAEQLVAEGYPYDFLLLSVTNTVTWDNDAPNEELVRFVRTWNAQGRSPRLRLVLPREVPAYLARQAPETIPIRRGDWTDWWSHGVGSTARETAVKAWASHVAAAARTLVAFGPALRPEDAREFQALTPAVDRELLLYDEHTWGSAESISHPDAVHSVGQWVSKASHAYEAAAGATRLFTLATRRLGAAMARAGRDEILLVNPLPWAVNQRVVLPPRRAPAAFGGAWPLHELARDLEMAHPVHPVYPAGDPVDYGLVSLPAAGCLAIPAAPPTAEARSRVDRWQLESPWLAVRVDPVRGSLVDIWTRDGKRWRDPESPFGLAEYVGHRLDQPQGRRFLQPVTPARDVRPDWAIHEQRAMRVLSSVPSVGPGLARLTVALEAEGMATWQVTYTVYDSEPWLDVDVTADPGASRALRSTYLVFPFELAGAVLRYGSQGATVTAEVEQLPNACRDYYSVDFVDVSTATRGVTIVTPDAPLIMWGDFTAGAYLEHHYPNRPWVIGWPFNNYWHTNFKADQPGAVHFRYRLAFHDGPFDAVVANRLAIGTALPPLAVVPLAGEAGTVFPVAEPDAVIPTSWYRLEPEAARIVGASVVSDEPRRRRVEVVLHALADVDAGKLSVGRPWVVHGATQIDPSTETRRPLPLQDGQVLWTARQGAWIVVELDMEAENSEPATHDPAG